MNKSITPVIVTVIMAVVYVMAPVDLVPDAMPIAGWIDDVVAVLLAVANVIRYFAKK